MSISRKLLTKLNFRLCLPQLYQPHSTHQNDNKMGFETARWWTVEAVLRLQSWSLASCNIFQQGHLHI